MTKTKSDLAMERIAALDQLAKLLKPGDTVWTKLIHVSRSGMYRVIDCFAIKDNEPLRITWSVATLCGGYDRRHEGAKASGCGMDMGFSLVYNTSLALFPHGFGCIGEGCPSCDHSNGDRDYTPHYDGTPRGASEVGKSLTPYNHMHSNGGYALRHRWL
jgi:hypothetical protein